MRSVVFPYEKFPSRIFGAIYRPVVAVNFWCRRLGEWREVIAIADTGADYSVLPRFYAYDLGIDLKKECSKKRTKGIGGEEHIHIYQKMKVSFLNEVFTMPVGFVSHDDLPPIVGHKRFLEKFKITLHRRQIRFENK